VRRAKARSRAAMSRGISETSVSGRCNISTVVIVDAV
jgi:hypothetical protein